MFRFGFLCTQEKFAILSPKPQSHVRISFIERGLFGSSDKKIDVCPGDDLQRSCLQSTGQW